MPSLDFKPLLCARLEGRYCCKMCTQQTFRMAKGKQTGTIRKCTSAMRNCTVESARQCLASLASVSRQLCGIAPWRAAGYCLASLVSPVCLASPGVPQRPWVLGVLSVPGVPSLASRALPRNPPAMCTLRC